MNRLRSHNGKILPGSPVADLSLEVEEKPCGTPDSCQSVTPTEIITHTPHYISEIKEKSFFQHLQPNIKILDRNTLLLNYLKFSSLKAQQ